MRLPELCLVTLLFVNVVVWLCCCLVTLLVGAFTRVVFGNVVVC